MNRDEAKQILLLYRPGTADAEDSQVVAALALAKQDAELSRWLEAHLAKQEMVRAKFREIQPPAGLREQIISEQAARARIVPRRRIIVFATAAVMICVGLLMLWQPWLENDFANYRSRMARVALTGYAMDLETNDVSAIRAYLAGRKAPADFVLPASLQKVIVSGCAVENWNDTKVAMLCFRTGQPLAPGAQSDLWLFVMDRNVLKKLPAAIPEFAKANRLVTAAWTEGDKVYLLGIEGDEQRLRPYL